MFVFDTSAYINGWRYHYPRETFGKVWERIGEALADGRVISPREVLRELEKKDDDLFGWSKNFRSAFVPPTDDVQAEAGRLQAAFFPNPGTRDAADPWVIAEAKVKGLTVVTYEGTSINGTPTVKASTKMPGFCAAEGVDCVILGQALGQLGNQL